MASIRADGLPPELGVGLPLVGLAVIVAGVRAGRSTRSGVTGRIQSFVQSVRGLERNRLETAGVAGALLAVGYVVPVVGLAVGGQSATALVGGFDYGLFVGVSAARVGALY